MSYKNNLKIMSIFSQFYNLIIQETLINKNESIWICLCDEQTNNDSFEQYGHQKCLN